jgi:S-adenosylmethionine decarboxylase proenzyme
MLEGQVQPQNWKLHTQGLPAVGRHLIVEMWNCKPSYLANVNRIRRAMIHAAALVGNTVIDSMFHEFQPWGITGILLLAESHMSVHTWPERSYAAFDMFSCGSADPAPAFDYIAANLGCVDWSMIKLERGLRLATIERATTT